MRSRWGAIAKPHAKVFDPPALPSPTPGAWPQQQNKNSVQYVFYLLFVRKRTKFGIKILELTWKLKFNDIWPFDLTLRSPVWP